MSRRCPACKQTVPIGARVRRCANCKMPIDLHHKWHFQFRGNTVQMVHRHCDAPTSYLSEAEYQRKYRERGPR